MSRRAPRGQLGLGLAPRPTSARKELAEAAVLLPGFARDVEGGLRAALDTLLHTSPPRHMQTPGGRTMSIATTSCGVVGWTSDARGYRYAPVDPADGRPWPAIPEVFETLARRAADVASFPGFLPDSCLVNLYEPGARLSLHRDENERDLRAPIVSVSLGLSATFLLGGATRADRPLRVPVDHADVIVFGGESRLRYHGVLPVPEGEHPFAGRLRINLTFRRALDS